MLKHLEFLKALPQYEQGSKEWLKQRKGKLTSSDVATALGLNPYKKPVELLLEKCGAGKLFDGNESTEHGHKYESEAIQKYELLMGKVNHTFGMISFSDLDSIRTNKKYVDKKYHFLGGSPDGITTDKVITDKSILMQLEAKCPLRRKIKHGQIPIYYYPQVQTNMFIMDLEATDFIEYIPNSIGNEEFNIVRIYRNEEWFDRIFPILENFWSEVEVWKTKDITTHPEYNKYYKKEINIPKYMFIETDEERPSIEDNDVCMFDD